MFKKLLLLTIFVWFAISIFRFGDHLFRISAEESKTIFASDDAKRKIQFGEVYDSIEFIGKATDSNSKVAVVSTNGEYFYLARYYLFPRIVVWIRKTDNIEFQEFSALLVDGYNKNLIVAIRGKYKVTKFQDFYVLKQK